MALLCINSSLLVGVALAIFLKKSNFFDKLLNCISAGIMVGIAIFHLLGESFDEFTNLWLLIILFSLGVLVSGIIESSFHKKGGCIKKSHNISLVIIILHSIPEGILYLTLRGVEPNLAVPLFWSLLFHHIPIGVVVGNALKREFRVSKVIAYTVAIALSQTALTYLIYKGIGFEAVAIGIKYLNPIISGILVYFALDLIYQYRKSVNAYIIVGLTIYLIYLL